MRSNSNKSLTSPPAFTTNSWRNAHTALDPRVQEFATSVNDRHGATSTSVEHHLSTDAPHEDGRLSPEQKAVLHHNFRARPLRRVIAQQPPFLWPRAAVEQALRREVVEQREYLSITDVWELANSATHEIVRRSPQGLNLTAEVDRLFRLADDDGFFDGRTPGSDPWLTRTTMGPIESRIAALPSSTTLRLDALPPLLKAQARRLDCLLNLVPSCQCFEERLELEGAIRDSFERLLGHSFSLGDNGPQDACDALQQRIRTALDELGFKSVHTVATPTKEMLLEIGFEPLKKRQAPSMAGTSGCVPIEPPRSKARVEALHAMAEPEYVKLMSIERFWRTCEAFGAFLGWQPIKQLAQLLPAEGMEDATKGIGARVGAEFCRAHGPAGSTDHATSVPLGAERSPAIVDWLGTLGTTRAILWAGSDPRVMAVKRRPDGTWIARVSTQSKGATWSPLLDVLDALQLQFAFQTTDEPEIRGGVVEALTWGPPVAEATTPVRAEQSAESAVQPLPAMGPSKEVEPRPSSTRGAISISDSESEQPDH